MTSSITSFVASYGVYAVFLLMAIDAVFPAASELVMLYAGALASGAIAHHHPNLFGATLGFGIVSFLVLAGAGTVGYVVGSLVGWLIGARGRRPLLAAHGRWFHLTPSRLDAAERWFDRYGDLAVLIGRVTPLIRSFISIPAGVFSVPLARYLSLSLVGSAIWSFAFAGAGWGLGSGYSRIHNAFQWVEIVVVLAAVSGLAALILLRRRHKD